VADVVCLRALRCRRRTARRAARLLSLAAPRRPPAALARGRSGRGARAPQRSEARRGPRPVFAPAVPALQRRVGVADASAEERPGAALARDVAGPRSAAREHQRRGRRRVRESRVQALQRPRGARTARPRRCRPNSVRPQGSPQRAISERRRCPGGARGLRAAKRSASCQPARPKRVWARGALHGACRREVQGGAPGARRARARTFLAPRAGAAAVALSGSPRRLLRVRFVLYGEVKGRFLLSRPKPPHKSPASGLAETSLDGGTQIDIPRPED